MKSAVVALPTPQLVKLRALPGEPSPVYSRALEQHRTLQATLRAFAVNVSVVEADSALAGRIGDAAAVAGEAAFIMRSASVLRESEQEPIAQDLQRRGLRIGGAIEAPGLFDASQLVLAGERALIGVSDASNASGRRQIIDLLQREGYECTQVRVDDSAPLRARCTAVSDGTLVVAARGFEREALRGFETIQLALGEEAAAALFVLGPKRLLANLRFRTSLHRLHQAGFSVEAIDLWEFGKVGILPPALILPVERSR